MQDFKVVYIVGGSEFIYGYADTLGEAIGLDNECADYGWLKRVIKEWNSLNGTWVPVN